MLQRAGTGTGTGHYEIMYCDMCGTSHRADKCKKKKGKKGKKLVSARVTRSTRQAMDVPKVDSRESSPELCDRLSTLTLEDQETSLTKEIKEMELEERIAELQERRDAMKRKRQGRLQTDGDGRSRGTTPVKDEWPTAATTGAAAVPAGASKDEYSSYGVVKPRHRSRTRRRRQTPSDSRSRSSSSTRRLRSKWSLRRYAALGKDVKKMNCYELVTASIRWVLDIQGVTVKDLRAFLEHICFMSSRARQNDFHDSTHVEYDKDVRKLAEVEGFAAFGSSNTGMGMFHYGMHNMRPKKPVNSFRKSNTYAKEGKPGCYRWNKEGGCSRTDENCNFGHWCLKCGSRSHKKINCTKD